MSESDNVDPAHLLQPHPEGESLTYAQQGRVALEAAPTLRSTSPCNTSKHRRQAVPQIGQSYAEFVESMPHESWDSALKGFGNPKLPRSHVNAPIKERWINEIHILRAPLLSPFPSPVKRHVKTVLTFGEIPSPPLPPFVNRRGLDVVKAPTFQNSLTPPAAISRPSSSMINREMEERRMQRAVSAQRRGGAPRNVIFPRMGAHICGAACTLPRTLPRRKL